jgi:conjugal transfer/entry exclusion protein
MKLLGRRRALSAALASSFLAREVTLVSPAQADFWGGDLPLLAAILAQAIEEVINLGSMLTQIISEVQMMTTMLKAVGSGSFLALVNFIITARNSYNALTDGVHAMTYTLGRIDAEYKKLFPADQPPPGTTVAQHKAQYVAWHQEVVGAAQVAARQQTNLATLDDHASKTQAILDQSKDADGIVAQLQCVVQMIGITNAQLILMNQTLSTTGRVLTDVAAGGAAEKQLSLSKKDDSRAGYTDKGPPTAVPHNLP